MKPTEVLSEIEILLIKLIETGLSNEQNWPILNTLTSGYEEVAITGAPNMAVSMKNVAYDKIYNLLSDGRCFHVKMIDGTLLQMCYRFHKKEIVAHRLCAFPAPHLTLYDQEPDLYDQDEIFADIVAKNIVHVPIRFDFDLAAHKDIDHPKSHLTLGQYVNCRIPVIAPLAPARFIKFILRNFYFNAFQHFGLSNLNSKKCFPKTITANEQMIAHLNC